MDLTPVGFTRFSRHGANLGRLHVTEARHVEGLDGTDTLEVTCTEDLAKNDYIVWRDRQGTWREHIVDTFSRTHDEMGAPLTAATCINSIAETWDDYVNDRRPSGTAYAALTSILATSRWVAGTCTQETTQSHTFYHISVREAIQELLEVWGGELETVIHCDGSKVTSREVRVSSVRGNQSSPKRFTWSKDLVSIARDVASDNPKSRLYAFGRGEETETGGYGRRIGIEDVNPTGMPYVEDAEATAMWGHPMPDGTIKASEGVYLNEECDDPEQLLQEVTAALEVAKSPVVSYKAEVIDLVSFGRDWEDVALGDLVTIIDREFSEEGLRLRGRVSRVERDLLTYDTSVTFGTLVDAIANPWQSLQTKLSSLSRRSANWDMAGTASVEWLETLLTELNAAYNQVGTYHFSSFEKGEIWSNVPLDSNGNPTRSGGWAMNINGQGFRLANGTTAGGEWNWRAFGNGNGFTADEINAGSINASLITTGIISGSGIIIDLDRGITTLQSTASVGDRTVSQLLSDVDATITDVDVEYAQGTSPTVAPTTGWSTTAPAWESGKYVWQRTKTTTASGVSYSNPTNITGAKGDDGTSVTILGSYDTYAQLIAAHPTGSVGDGYMVGGDLYVWDGTQWEDVGTIQGPQGPTGPQGPQGPQGAAGSAGSAGATAYVHTAWANDYRGMTDFSTTDSTNRTYLGVYTDHTSADSQDPTSYNWSLIKGAKGDTGATGATGPQGPTGATGEDGVSIVSIVEQYYLSTSSTTQTGGSWSANQPTWTSGKYIWTRSLITWDTTPVTTTTTTPVLAKAINGANQTAKEAADQAAQLQTLVREYEDGVLVCRPNQNLGALIDSDSSFKVVWVTWDIIDGSLVPTAATEYATLGVHENAPGTGTQKIAYTLGSRASESTVGSRSVALGLNVTASGGYAVAEGNGTTASGNYSHSEGEGSMASGSCSHAEGDDIAEVVDGETIRHPTTASGQASHAEGRATVASGSYSHAEGDQTEASEQSTHAEGAYTVASEAYAHAEGRYTTADGTQSHAEGYHATASGSASHAEGTYSVASGNYSHAEGNTTTASGAQSHAEGNGTTAEGNSSYAEGDGCVASGAQSHAEGYHTIASGASQTAMGQYNAENTNAKLIVGNGNGTTRKNAFVVLQNGNATLAGTLTQSSDRRLKEHHAYLDEGDGACAFVRSLRPALYSKDGARHVGFYAQDVLEAEPDDWGTDIVTEVVMDESMPDMLQLDYTAIIAPLVAYCHRLEERIARLEESH